MKNFIKTLIVLLAGIAMAFGVTAFAGINDDPRDLDTFRVTNQSGLNGSANGWSRSTSIGDDDLLSFAIYYHVTTGTGNNVTFSMENINGRTYQAGQSVNVDGRVDTSNVGSAAGSSNVTFTDDVELQLINVSWQPNQCTSVTCEQPFPGSAGSILGSGINVGSIESGFPNQGSIVAAFRAVPVQSQPPVDPPVNPPTFIAPDVDTRSESNVDEDEATLNGEVDFSSSVTSGDVFFEYGTSISNLNNTTSRIFRNTDSTFSINIDDLDEDTTYYYQALLLGNDGEVYRGGIESFRTDDDNDNNFNDNDDVEVQTDSATSIDDDSARLNGELEEGDNVEVWFAFDEDDETPSCSDSRQRIDVNGSFDEGDDFSRTVTGLDEDEEYFFRACAEGDNGDIESGNIRNFFTDDDDDDRRSNNDDAEVSTESPSSVDDDSARLNGELEEGDNVEVWFAFSSTDRTPSCLLSSQRIDVNGVFDDGDEFSRTVTGLSRNTIYYYRACALGDNGDIETGSIREFITDEEDDNGDNGGTFFPQFPTPSEPLPPVFTPIPTTDATTVTRLPAAVTTNSATLRSFVTGEGNGSCFFEYGTSTNFGSTSPSQPVNLNSTGECSSTRFGLAPNTTYFYRSVLVDDRGNVERGLTRSFRTTSNPTVFVPSVPTTPTVFPSVPTTPTPVDTTVRVTVVEEVEQVSTRSALELTKFVSSFDDPRFTDETEADRNEAVFYKVVVRNNTTDVLEDITVVDFIPFALELDGQQSLDDNSDKEVRWRIAQLQPGDSREFTTEMRVRDDVRLGSVIDSFATAFNEDISVNSNQVFIEVEEDVVDISATNEGSQAASIFGAGFLPGSLAGWLVLVGIVLAIAYLISRILFSRNENERVLAELRAMQNNQ